MVSCQGTLIPAGEDIETFSVDEDVAWILIVEKEVGLPFLNHDKAGKLRISGSFSDPLPFETHET